MSDDATASRPNILLLMSDEHRYDVAGFAGNDVIRTPFLDKLSATGVTFDNAYTPSPICIPCRQSMAVGQRPRTCGVERYGQDLPPNSMTFARRLGQFGYETCCAGKLHHMGPDQMQGWSRRLGMDFHVGDGFRDFEVAPPAAPDDPGIGKWSDAKEVARAGTGHGPATQDVDEYALVGAELFTSEYFADPFYDRPQSHRPLLMMLSFVRPHYPYFTDEDRFRYYLNRVAPYYREPVFDHPFLGSRGIDDAVSEREVRRATAAYYGMIDEIDADYARFSDHLEHLGQDLDDWWIVYTSDHGEMLGQHGVWEKQKFFEASARVPLVVRPPRALRDEWQCEGRRVSDNVSLLDLFPTLCDASSATPPDGHPLDGASLVPLMQGTSRASNEVTSEFDGHNLMIKRGPLKYQWYARHADTPHAEVLFDLDADPAESRNLIDEPRYAEGLLAFRARRVELGF
ncbi:MAG: sulfatase-like hydrolase/transferase [Planctomycetota bacterium]